jgi:hypothetical protein
MSTPAPIVTSGAGAGVPLALRHQATPLSIARDPKSLAFALLSGALLLLLGGMALSDTAPDFPARRQDPSLVRAAAYADGRLWLLAGDELTTISDNGLGRVAEPVEGKPIALCVQSKQLLTLSAGPDERWTLRRRQAAGWVEVAHIGTRGDTFVGMACGANEVSLLTNRRLITIGGVAPQSIGLSDRLNQGVTHSLLSTGDLLLIGTNAGEWGGGLQRIDRRTGKVSQLQRNDSGDPCDAVLDRQCDPVNGLASAPWNSKCVVAAVGMVHMSERGRLIEVCGDRIEPLYAKALPDPNDAPGVKPFNEVAFFGAHQAGDALWAVGIDGLYRFRDRKLVDFAPLPAFRTVDGVRVSFDLPGVVLVMTDINQSVSLSGSVPMLVPR